MFRHKEFALYPDLQIIAIDKDGAVEATVNRVVLELIRHVIRRS